MSKTLLLVAIAGLVILLGAGAAFATATGAAETAVTCGVAPVTTPNPGDTNVLLLDITITDPPAGDGLPTQIETITITRTPASTLDETAVSRLRVYHDANADGDWDVGEPLLGTITNPSLNTGAVFGIPRRLWRAIPNDSSLRLLFVVDLNRNYTGIADGQTLLLQFNATVVDNLSPGVASSRFATALPVVADHGATITFATGANDVRIDDATPAVGNANLGEMDVVVQAFTILNPPVATPPPTNPARLDTVTIGPTPTNTIPDADVTAFRLYWDRNNNATLDGLDVLLSTVTAPNLTNRIQFGTHGVLMDVIANDDTHQFFIVADFTETLSEGDVLQVQVTGVTFKDNVVTDPGGTSDYLRPGQLPVPAEYATTVLFASAANADSDLVSIGSDGVIHPTNVTGRTLLAMQIQETDNDGSPTDIEYVWVERFFKTGPPLPDAAIERLRLYREDGTTPGWQADEDVPLGTLTAPINLNDGVSNSFGTFGESLVRVADGGVRTIYVIGDFDRDQLQEGQVLALRMRVRARDGLTPASGTGLSSRFAVANSVAVTQGVPKTVSESSITIGDVTMSSVGTVDISINVPTPGLGSMDVTLNFNPTIVQVDRVESLDANYTVVTNLINNRTGTIRFGCFLSGDTPRTSGAIVRITLDAIAVGSSPLTLTLTTFRDTTGADLPQNIVHGTATVTVAPPVDRGDVNEDGAVDITDARWAAEYAIGIRTLTAAQVAAADVALPAGVDITDARWIAEAAIGLRTLSVMAMKIAPTALPGTAQVAINMAGELIISGSRAELADIQGTLHFDPAVMNVIDIVGLNGFQILASSIDSAAGEVRFAAAKLSGRMVAEGALLQFVLAGDASQAVLDIDVLRDIRAREVRISLTIPMGGLEFGNAPNPVVDVNTTTFAVRGTAAALVDAIRVRIFDLSGRLVFEREEIGTTLDWHTDNMYGEFLANGVYLYKMYALINGEWIISEVKKLVILR